MNVSVCPGALVEPAAVAYQGLFVEGGGVPEGAAVVVYGAGPIGLTAIALAIASIQVEAAGAFSETVPEMLASSAPRGSIILFGRSSQATSLFLDSLLVTASRMIGSIGHAGPEAFPGVIAMMASGRLDLFPMVTARIALSDLPSALASGHAASAGKTLVRIDGGGRAA